MDNVEFKDGGHIILNCSNCGKPLVDIWITVPKLDVVNYVRAECCYCGDFSFIHTIKGGFRYSGIIEYINGSDDYKQITMVSNIEIVKHPDFNDNVFVYTTFRGDK